MLERPQDKWLAPDPAAQFRAYKDQRMKGAWFLVIWYGALLLFFAVTLTARHEAAKHNDSTVSFLVLPALVLARFGYYLYRLIKAHQDVEAMRHSLGIVA